VIDGRLRRQAPQDPPPCAGEPPALDGMAAGQRGGRQLAGAMDAHPAGLDQRDEGCVDDGVGAAGQAADLVDVEGDASRRLPS
jgi:hypothetical protein